MLFTPKPNPNEVELEKSIAAALEDLQGYPAKSAEHAAILEQLIKLIALRSTPKKTAISKDKLLEVGGSLAGILLILNYERVGVVASKAIGFVKK